MPEWLSWILSILLFIISLGILIAIHELGHFLAAKAFNVYVQEYAIGMGPKLFTKKRKLGETYFSLRAVPFGGFCSMYGEDVTIENGVRIPKERGLEGVSHPKRFIIFAAGILMNFVLAYVLFFINCAAFPQSSYYLNVLDIPESSLAAEAGINNHDILTFETVPQVDLVTGETKQYNPLSGLYVIDGDATLHIPESEESPAREEKIVVAFNASAVTTTNLNFNHAIQLLSVDKTDPIAWKINNDPGFAFIGENYSFTFTPIIIEGISSTSFDPDNYVSYDLEGNPIEREISPITVHATATSAETYQYDDIGLNSFEYVFRYSFTEAFGAAGEDWAEANTLLFRAVGGLLVGQGYDQLGGPIAILSQTTSILQTMSFGYYIWYWGVISCNLAIFNLLPFPGLDGWHLVVTLFEGITRKKIPNKVKNVISAIGMILLFGLMIVVLFKDVIGLF